jgi:hypothetical protein
MVPQLRHCKLNIAHCNGQDALTTDIGLSEKIVARKGRKARFPAIFCTKSTFQPVNYPVPSQAFQNTLLYGEPYER